MSVPEILLLTAGIGFTLLLAGYWLAVKLTGATPAERLAAAVLAGLGSLLLMVGAVNFFAPLAGFPAWSCVLLPCGLSLLPGRARRGLAEDVGRVSRQAGARWAMFGAAALWTALLWPMLRDPRLVYFDGSGNHDAFFWVANASHLRAHPYMQLPDFNPARPFTNFADVLVGWEPLWGRMGAEGLLALASAITGRPPLDLYRVATASLLLPWLAGVFLVLRAFVFPPGRPRPWVWGVAAGLQPVFGFFFRNDNLPNLLGALMAAAILVGLGRGFATDRTGPAWSWAGLAALGTHGLLCGYPEMLPFVMLPAGLLILCVWRGAGWGRAALAVATVAVGMAVNPATGLRGVHGFAMSVEGARADAHWFNVFSTLRPAAYLPALVTLSIPTCETLGRFWGAALTLGLLAALTLTVRRARDPFNAAALLAGAVALLLYTLLTGFSYGWQKTTEFAGVFIGALLPVGAVGTLDAMDRERAGSARLLVRTAAGLLLVFYLVATKDVCLSLRSWAGRKQITRDLLNLRTAPPARVLVIGESFPQPFFYGMWATYLLPVSDLAFSARDRNPGGYLEGAVLREFPGTTPPPDAVLVGRAWAETFDAASPRLSQGADYALLAETNRVLEAEGFKPAFGVPTHLANRARLRLLPARDGWLHLTVRPRVGGREEDWHLVVETRAGHGGEPTRVALTGGPLWTVALPLKGAVPNALTFEGTGPGVIPGDQRTFQIEGLRITSTP